mgnify:CR=1 FL=1
MARLARATSSTHTGQRARRGRDRPPVCALRRPGLRHPRRRAGALRRARGLVEPPARPLDEGVVDDRRAQRDLRHLAKGRRVDGAEAPRRGEPRPRQRIGHVLGARTAARWRVPPSRRHPQTGQPGWAHASTRRWPPFGSRASRVEVVEDERPRHPRWRDGRAVGDHAVDDRLPGGSGSRRAAGPGDHLGAVAGDARSQHERHAATRRLTGWPAGRPGGRLAALTARPATSATGRAAVDLRDIHADRVDHVPAVALRVPGAGSRAGTVPASRLPGAP